MMNKPPTIRRSECDCEMHESVKRELENTPPPPKQTAEWEKQRETDERIEKITEETIKRKMMPVVNLDNPEVNCEICGYDHMSMNELNKLHYVIKHALKRGLSEQLDRIEKAIDNIDWDWDVGPQIAEIIKKERG